MSAVNRPMGQRRFVVHHHRARRRHYDLRLEIDGLLVCWAVPRGPTLDPKLRRMAVHVADHSLAYFDFEGIIPAGRYGAGDVIVWDWGSWSPEVETPDPAQAIADGELKFVLQGEKLKGRFVLVRTGDPEAAPNQWLMLHKRDAHAVAGWEANDHPVSVRSGLTNDQVRDSTPAIWLSGEPADRARIDLSKALPAPDPPTFLPPMAASLAAKVPVGLGWTYEVKWDGFRVQAIVSDSRTRLFTRNGGDADRYFPGLLESTTWLNAHDAIVDGEVVALDATGRPDFNLLQERLGQDSIPGQARVTFQAFDLLRVDGRSLLGVPLTDRRKLLALILQPHPNVVVAEAVSEDGVAFLAAIRELGLEGLVAKRSNSTYQPGRASEDWLKVKIRPEQDLVVGGWTPSRANPKELGALAVGVYDGTRLQFAGKVGSGFTDRAKETLKAELALLAEAKSPFDPVPTLAEKGRWGSAGLADVRWVRPELVIRAQLGGWSSDGQVRQASYKGIDRGREPRAVTRERAMPPSAQTAGGEESDLAQALAALAELPPSGGEWRLDGVTLRLTNLDKPLFRPRLPDREPITKRDLIGYFTKMASAMLPHLSDRPLNLHRFPNGADATGFWQKALPRTAPEWLTRWLEPSQGRREPNTHVVADSRAALAWLGNQAAFEVHPWTSTCADPGHPTFALIDIDPGSATEWEETLTLAKLFRTALEHLAVTGLPKTTGSRGLQIWIPVRPGYTFEETSKWVEALSRMVAAIVPDLVSWEWATAARGGKARLDYTQNAPIKTLVAPYAVRPAAGAPVSTPIRWDELDDPELRSDRWTIRDLPARLDDVGDLFAAALSREQSLPSLD